MSIKMKKAFTIIEVMLVLSISGLILVGMMVGWSVNIDRQRYNEALNTLKSDVQGVYSDVENQTNSKTRRITCGEKDGSVSLNFNDGGARTGASDCVILGKFIVFKQDDSTSGTSDGAGKFDAAEYGHGGFTIYDIIGKDIDVSKDCGGKSCANTIEALKATKFVISAGANKTSDPATINLEWNSQYKLITDNRASKGRPFSGSLPDNVWYMTYNDPRFNNSNKMPDTVAAMAILRSPIDGSIISFGVPVASVGDGAKQYDKSSASYRDWFVDSRLVLTTSKTINICVRSDASSRSFGGLAFFGRNRVLKIGPTASSVEIAPLNGEGSISCGNGVGFSDVQVNERPI